MENESTHKKKLDPERVEILKALPRELKESLTIEETNAILFEDIWPDSLQEKLKKYMVEE